MKYNILIVEDDKLLQRGLVASLESLEVEITVASSGNEAIEKIEGKMYQFFPIQSSIIPNHIQIDTKSIIELLVEKEKKQYLDNVELNKAE